jgi:3-hydroxymyristoyl/3-hydroxydecanoyl-(acyl carrier protein) dehydratase
MRERPEILARRTPDASRVEIDFEVTGDIEYFAGHFPNAPIVPGVVQIKWAIDLGRELLGLEGRSVAMEVIKFKQVMTPGARVTLSLRLDEARNKLHFDYTSAQGAHSSGRIQLESAP